MSDYNFRIHIGPNDFPIAIIGRNGQPQVIEIDYDKYSMPSVVSFTKTKILVGEADKDKKIKNLENSIYEIGEIFVKQFDNQQKFMKVPFKIGKIQKQVNLKYILEVFFHICNEHWKINRKTFYWMRRY